MIIYICECGAIRNKKAKCRTKEGSHEKLGAIEINDAAFERKMQFAPNNVYKTDLNAWLKTHKKHLVETAEETTERTGDISE